MSSRVDFVKRNGREPVMLYFGDFDPSGMEMLEAMETTLRDELGVNGLEFKRIALLKDDIFTHKLPHEPTALKKADTRAKKHVKKYGELAVELDALRPDVLEQKIEDAIGSEMDVDTYNAEVERYRTERDEISVLKDRIMDIVA